MTLEKPKLSIITATHCAPGFLERAIGSVLSQSCEDWELVISPDDGIDYSFWEKVDSRIKVVRSEIERSGPGPTRNRGLEIATGQYVATLDDDDTLARNFVETVLDFLSMHDAVAVPTEYLDEDGTLIRKVGVGFDFLDIGVFARQLGSLIIVAKRDAYPCWVSGFAEDVVHACQIIDAAGGRVAMLADTSYRSTVRAAGICATREDIDVEYASIIEGSTADVYKNMSPDGIGEMRELFRFRRKINSRFERRANRNCGYHEFVQGLPIFTA
ncbi:MAG TPA: glycosyltransferase [Burkholderiaceae bacterium]|jgi:glycosyltransferase involved in cell wall biosynthesis|nr:glycosyltransferase [Burkholderiaceae bacterium]